MQQTKYFCDKCGKEFSGDDFGNYVEYSFNGREEDMLHRADIESKKIDLCKNCYNDFRKWLLK